MQFFKSDHFAWNARSRMWMADRLDLEQDSSRLTAHPNTHNHALPNRKPHAFSLETRLGFVRSSHRSLASSSGCHLKNEAEWLR